MRLYVEVARRTYARAEHLPQRHHRRAVHQHGVRVPARLRAARRVRPAARGRRLRRHRHRSRSPSWPRACSCRSACSPPPRSPIASPPATSSSTCSGPYDHQGWWAAVDVRQGRLLPRSSAASRRSWSAPSRSTCSCPSVANLRRLPRAPSALAVGISFGWRYLLQMSAFWLARRPRARTSSGCSPPTSCAAPTSRSCSSRRGSRASAGSCRSPAMLQVPIEVWLGQHHGHRPARRARDPAALARRAGRARAARARPGGPSGGGAGWLSADRRPRGVAAPRRRPDPRRLAVPHLVLPVPPQPDAGRCASTSP